MASWEEHARNFLLEEEEEDEELFFVLLPAVEDFVQYKKMQSSKTMEALNEKKKQDEEFSVHKCLDEVDAMDGLTDVEKSYAMDIFKTEIDREVFMRMKNKNVRFIWLKRQISALGGGNV